MKTLYVTGGEQRRGALRGPEWQHYWRAVLACIVTERRTVQVPVRYTSPPDVCPPDTPSIVFKAGTVRDEHLYVCTETEVLILELPSCALVHSVSLPCFNDLHHVRPLDDGSMLVANTGLDMVLKLDRKGAIVGEWAALGGNPWSRFDPAADYRTIATTKPHAAHPNYVFELKGDPWVTRFEQRDAISLRDPDRRISIDIERPHDGVVRDGGVYFTTVDGRIAIADAESLEVTQVMDLNALNDSNRALGWCRGLLVEDDRIWVGFSRLRPTPFQEHLSWLKHGGKRVGQYDSMPTRVVCYDRDCTRVLDVYDLERHGMNAVFSILGSSSR